MVLSVLTLLGGHPRRAEASAPRAGRASAGALSTDRTMGCKSSKPQVLPPSKLGSDGLLPGARTAPTSEQSSVSTADGVTRPPQIQTQGHHWAEGISPDKRRDAAIPWHATSPSPSTRRSVNGMISESPTRLSESPEFRESGVDKVAAKFMTQEQAACEPCTLEADQVRNQASNSEPIH